MHHVIRITENSVFVRSLVSLAAAKAQAEKNAGAVIVSTEDGLSQFGSAALVSIHNKIALKEIKGFHDKAAGMARVWAILEHTETDEADEEGERKTPTTPAPRAKAKAKEPKAKAKATKAPAKEPKAKKEAGGTRKWTADQVISKVMANPKREGSASWERYKLYREGMTVAAALKAGIWPADLNWDQKQGFIKIA